MQVQVRVDEQGALRNGRFAFSNRFTLVTELLQNARRAGASYVDVEYDEEKQVLLVRDDGKGIEDFQTLLLINKSGWDEATQAEELPFGVEFSKCLYSASRVIVTSRGKRIDFETDAALAQAMIDVVEADAAAGTTVELHGVELPKAREAITRLVRGFSIPVWLNGEELPRPYAVNAEGLELIETEIGKVYLAGTRTGRHSRTELIFLQGFCVRDETRWGNLERINVVHLDSTKFRARLPDRDTLIDETEQLSVINNALKTAWLDILRMRKAELDATKFCELYFDAASDWGLADMFDDVPLLPRQVYSQIEDYPYQSDDSTALIQYEKTISRSDVESGSVLLCQLDDPEEENILYWMFARARGYIHIDADRLGDKHWVKPYVNRFMDAEEPLHVGEVLDEEVVAEPVNVRGEAWFDGAWVSGKVILCDVYTLTYAGVTVEIREDATVSAGRFLVPEGEGSGQVCLQMSDYMNDGHWEESRQDQDTSDFADFIRRLRAVDPEKTLQNLLQDLTLEKYPVLHGKTFRISVGAEHGSMKLELVA